jgi:uncharacterized protein (TIGR03435 family)
MRFRFLAISLIAAAAGLFGQFDPPSLFGPVAVHLKAGDFAPDLRFDKTLHSATGIPWNQGNLSAHLSALVFLPDTHDNPDLVTKWNALVEKFGDKVQFIWITAEEESSILPWLAQHPMNGWVFNDRAGKSGQAYGLEEATVVFVGADHRILGFDGDLLPREEVLNAALEGRITTAEIKPPATVAEALAQAKAMSESGVVHIGAEPPGIPRFEDHKPEFAPSRTLHISPAKDQLNDGDYAGDDYWSLQGFDLKSLISQITGLNPSSIDLPASLDTRTRYDFALVLPTPEDKASMGALIQQEIERQFHLVATHENRPRTVYVLTAGEKKPPAAADSPSVGFASSVGYSSSVWVDAAGRDAVPSDLDPRDFKPPSIGEISDVGLIGTADEFCHFLEQELDRPGVNETGLEGNFKFEVKGREGESHGNTPPAHDFVERLRDQLGLIVTEEQRDVDTLVFTLTTR